MSRLRTILVACLTFAVAALPMAGTMTSAAVADATHDTQAPCAEHAEAVHADRDHENHSMAGNAEPGQTRGPCVDHAACSGKCLCLGVTAVLTRASEIRSSRLPRPSTTRLSVDLGGPAYVPPSPPPRV